ncbi:MAG: DUF3341 domain-containing protein [Emcibacter sp.]|nr:DUF3341 domain-containing protein [Emcibacter sp.]
MTIREAVAVFDTEEEMLDVIDELGSAGIDRRELSVMPSVENVEKQIGHSLKSVKETENDPNIIRAIPFDVASFGNAQGLLISIPAYLGAISMAIASAVIVESYFTIAILVSGGGAIGALLGYFLAKLLRINHQRQIKKQLDKGGLVLWVHLRDKKHEKNVKEILSQHKAHDVHMHNVVT